MSHEPPPEVTSLLGSPTELVRWLETQAPELQACYAETSFGQLLREAAQPKSISGSACVRLCGFVDQCSKAQAEELRLWAFSRDATFGLFNFYMEWNESDHQRSMRLVLDLVVQLLKINRNQEQAASTKSELLDSLVSIIIGRSTKPVAKPAIKTLDLFLTKTIFTVEEVKSSYVSFHPNLSQNEEVEIWRLFMVDLFHWMRFHFVCPIAGKFIVCLYRCLRHGDQQSLSTRPSMETWHMWLLDFTKREPSLLESTKNYVLLPYFNADKTEALRFLRMLNEHSPVIGSSNQDLDAAALLQLAALETGKRIGLVEEPDLGRDGSSSGASSAIVLEEQVLDTVLTHPSHAVRSLALSLLVTSPSTTRPYSSTAFDLLRKHLAALFADADAKFRVDVSSKTRDMFKRVRGAIFVLKRSIPRAKAKAQKSNAASNGQGDGAVANTPGPAIYRSNLISLPEAQLTASLEHHQGFLKWYMGFLCAELAPTVSYQRHIASLKSLLYILRLESQASKAWETQDDQDIFYDVFDDKWMRALFDLVVNPFEDVRETASAALKWLFADERFRKFSLACQGTKNSIAKDITELSKRADILARRTARADHADGAAKASQLVYRFLDAGGPRLAFLSALISELDGKISFAEKDLGRAVLEAPIHGDFASLCFIWRVVSDLQFSSPELESVLALQHKLVTCCERTWNVVRDILCEDSPEGHLPQELEDLAGLDTKDLLSYSFRAIHESSNLIRTMVLTIRNRSQTGSISPPQKLFEGLGNLTFDQLSNLRHRGAFTTVSLTFATCCQQSKHLEYNEQEEKILETWYKGTMAAIFALTSTTRRSAGIPSLMTGILSANAAEPSFETVMEQLMDIAGTEAQVTEIDEAKLPQVHAYNCLKDIFKSSFLTNMGNKAEKFLPQCLELAASGLRSEVWAIRNCGLIFLRSLIDCLFGSHESKLMIESGWDGKANRIAYHRYPNLPIVLRNLLKSGHLMMSQAATTTSGAESVFPALDIVRRAGPPDILREELQIHIASYLSSPVWHVREIAARTLCSCLLHEKWLHTVQGIFRDALNDKTSDVQNHIHGVLLTLKFVFERFADVEPERLGNDIPELALFLRQCHIDVRYVSCPDILAAYLEVINTIWAFQKLKSQPLEPFEVSPPGACESALLKTQRIVNGVYFTSQYENPVERLRLIILNPGIGANSLVAALEILPQLWHPEATGDSMLASLCVLYVDICLATNFAEAQAVAIQNLAEAMDRLLAEDKLDRIPVASLVDLWAGLPVHTMNPALSNAVVRVSGCVLVASKRTQGVGAQGIRNWGMMIADAGQDHQTFDTRIAAVEALRSLFTAPKANNDAEETLPALIALYDALNDDDDEVRDVASEAARAILGQAIVPLEAAARLLSYMAKAFADSIEFKHVVAGRMIGFNGPVGADQPWEPASAQLTAALEFDDSLFAVEDQNLFIDEIREAERWAAVFRGLSWNGCDETISKLDSWYRDGMDRLCRLAQQEDGPLGWASDPRVYAVCIYIIQGSSALVNQRLSAELQHAAAEVTRALRSENTHVSRLLTDSWEDV